MKASGRLALLPVQFVAIEQAHGADGGDVAQAEPHRGAETVRTFIQRGIFDAADVKKSGQFQVQSQIDACFQAADDGGLAANGIAVLIESQQVFPEASDIPDST